ncbi:MAG: leucyl aminopeptidase family protein, partial [Rhodospirillales bacterium]|nr:leucyl aminopeptidase family protein [Rhodospirillales bacterium]
PRGVMLLADGAALGSGWRALRARMAGVDLARELVSEPANVLNPSSFVDRLAPLRAAGIAIRTLDARALAREGCGALLAVGQGSVHPPRLAVLRWPGHAPQEDPLVFVGKGLTFDTGGICIKPAAGMEEMRADMAGAAACAGALLSLALQDAPMPAMAVLAIAENMTGGASYRPGDVLRSASGRSIEVVDTDAEGRLALADALAYAAKRLRPRGLIDLATLTGAIITALGHEKAGLFASHEGLAGAVVAAGAAVGEPVWRMPIGEAHRRDLDSDIADLRHCVPGRGQPDACHAAAFLREFTAGLPWAHLDIASVETWAENDERHAAGASGFGVRLLDALAGRLGTMPASAWP